MSNRTYGIHKHLPGIYFAIFTNIWSFLLWSPVIASYHTILQNIWGGANSFSTAVPFWGQTTLILSVLSPEWDCSP